MAPRACTEAWIGKHGRLFRLIPSTRRHATASSRPVEADVLFERRWAFSLLQRALDRVGSEFETAGKRAEFEILKDWLAADRGEIPYQEIAQKLATSEGAARVAIHRLRKRFREIFREVIAETVSEPGEVEDEMRHLAVALGRNADTAQHPSFRTDPVSP